MARTTDRWNHNVHYYPLILNAVPDGARRALDVGCGEGMLARELRRRVPDVTSIDLDETSLELAEAQNANDRIRYVRGDFLTCPFEPASFDVVTTVAALHHMEVTVALGRVRVEAGRGSERRYGHRSGAAYPAARQCRPP